MTYYKTRIITYKRNTKAERWHNQPPRQCFLVTADVKISQTQRLTVDRQPGKSGHGQSTGGERPMKTHQHTSNQFKEKQKQCP